MHPQPHACPPWDHPRACGEKPRLPVIMDVALGSPPRMRGKDQGFIVQITCKGITPAHAGKSVMLLAAAVDKLDHPRACGEKTWTLVWRGG